MFRGQCGRARYYSFSFSYPQPDSKYLDDRALPCLPIRIYEEQNTQSILIILGVHICKFIYLVKFICNLKIGTWGTFAVICGHVQRDKKFELSNMLLLAEVEQGNNLFHLSYCNHLFSTNFLHICAFLFIMLLFKITHKCSAGVILSVQKYKKSVMYLIEKIYTKQDLFGHELQWC